MVKTVTTYAKQRFSLLLFGALALFLFLFAKGNLALGTSDLFLFLTLLVLLFIFRLFDDLQNQEFDLTKPNRSYTEPENHRKLQTFLGSISLVFFALLFVLKPVAGVLVLGFFVLNLVLYKLLLNRWKFRNLLPLLKYPFFGFLLTFFLRPELLPDYQAFAFSLTLLPAFILYETLTDEDFSLPKWSLALLFLLVFLPFFQVFHFAPLALVLAATAALLLLALLYFRHKTLPYLLLLLLLIIRLTLPV